MARGHLAASDDVARRFARYQLQRLARAWSPAFRPPLASSISMSALVGGVRGAAGLIRYRELAPI